MERLKCKTCGCYSMMPVEIDEQANDEDLLLGDEQESRFFTCHVCGDNWLSVKQIERGDCQITFVHQMGMQPLLKRVAHMDTPVVLNENTIGAWSYYLGEDEVEESEWHDVLDKRRLVLRAICTN
jgi:hypothetical protein